MQTWLAALWGLALSSLCAAFSGAAAQPTILVGELPAPALAVLHAIDSGGPYAFRRDGVIFHNRERRLPDEADGYYREYTVAPPGAKDRGGRRSVTGGTPPVHFWYSADHYRTFRRIER